MSSAQGLEYGTPLPAIAIFNVAGLSINGTESPEYIEYMMMLSGWRPAGKDDGAGIFRKFVRDESVRAPLDVYGF